MEQTSQALFFRLFTFDYIGIKSIHHGLQNLLPCLTIGHKLLHMIDMQLDSNITFNIHIHQILTYYTYIFYRSCVSDKINNKCKSTFVFNYAIIIMNKCWYLLNHKGYFEKCFRRIHSTVSVKRMIDWNTVKHIACYYTLPVTCERQYVSNYLPYRSWSHSICWFHSPLLHHCHSEPGIQYAHNKSSIDWSLIIFFVITATSFTILASSTFNVLSY